MLDIKFIIENQKLIKDSIKKRGQTKKISYIGDLVTRYNQWKSIKLRLDKLRNKRNNLSKEINEAKKQKKDIKPIIKQAKELPNKILKIETTIKEHETKINFYLKQIPNILHKSVPKGKDESQNKTIRKVGKVTKFKFKVKNHVQLIESLDIGDFDASARISGNGFYYLKGKLALLNQALIRYTTDLMLKKKYNYIEPPLMIHKKVAEAQGDFEAFENALYKIENEDLYLIPTAEHPILSYLTNKTIKEEDLPLKFFGYSMCFRKEIGSHGINEKGLWRTHQFNKVEQFIFCKPKDSWNYYKELSKNSEEIIKKLKLPYRIVEICSGDLGNWKARSEDIEVYRPTTKKYEEVGSLSNCTDYQARDLNIRGVNKKGERYVLHTLNNTALATSRIMVAIIENNQQKDGSIKVPAVLQKYTKFKKIENAKNKRTKGRRNKKRK